MNTSTEITTKTKSSAAVVPSVSTFSPQVFNSRDIILPVIKVRQNSVKNDAMKPFKPGDIVIGGGTDYKQIAGENKTANFVPLSIEKGFIISDVTKNEARVVRYEPYSAAKEVERNFTEGTGRDEKHLRRDSCFIAYVLFCEGLEKQAAMLKRMEKNETVDPGDIALPARIVFKRTGLQAGKVLNTHFLNSASVRQSPAKITFGLKSIEKKNDRGAWFDSEIVKIDTDAKYTPAALLPVCEYWVQSMAKSQFKVVDDTEDDVVDTVSAPIDESKSRF